MASLMLFDEFASHIGTDEHVLGSDVIKVALVDSTKTPNPGEPTPTWGDFSANEVSGTGYVAGGQEITTDTYTESDGVAIYDGDDVLWSYNANGFTNARWAILYNDTNAADAAIGYIDLGGTISQREGDLSLVWGSGGVFRVEILGEPMQDGVIYVSPNGNDSWSGKSWSRPKLTISGAHSALPSTGGRIYLDAGAYTLDELTIAKEQVQITGAAAGASQFQLDGSATYGFKIDGGYKFKLENVMLTGTSFNGRAIWIADDSDYCIFNNVWFHYLSTGWSGSNDIDVAPCCVYIAGTTEGVAYTDWHKFHQIEMWYCNRGIVQNGEANMTLTDSTARNMIYETIWSNKNDSGGDIYMANCWLVGCSQADYMIKLTNVDTGHAYTTTRLVGNTTEMNAGESANHIYLNQATATVTDHHFNGGITGGGDAVHAVYLDTWASDCQIGPYRALGKGAEGAYVTDNSGNTNNLWNGYGTLAAPITGVWSASGSKTITEDASSGNASSEVSAYDFIRVGGSFRHVDSVTDDDTIVLSKEVTVSADQLWVLSDRSPK